MKIRFTDKTFPHEIQELDAFEQVIRAKKITDSTIPLAKLHIQQIADRDIGGFGAHRFSTYVAKAIDLSYAKAITIKTKD